MKKRSNRLWLLLAAAGLLVLIGLLSSGTKVWLHRDRRPAISFPRNMNEQDSQRVASRRKVLSLLVASGAQERREVDPFDVALGAVPPDAPVVFIEAAALFSSPIGQLLADCLDAKPQVQELIDQIGVDPVLDIERLALAGETVVVGGDLSGLQRNELGEDTRRSALGQEGALYEQDNLALGLWSDELAIVSSDTKDIAGAVDRIEGRAPFEQGPLAEEERYGHVYGRFPADKLVDVLSGAGEPIMSKVRDAVRDVSFHVDLSDGAALVAELHGDNEATMNDLARTLGGALSLLRIKAAAQGNTELSSLLDAAKVIPQGTSFTVEVALPFEMVEKALADCANTI